MNARIEVPRVIFPCGKWPIRIVNNEVEAIAPIKGTWALFVLKGEEIRVLSCPRCGHCSTIPREVEIDRDGNIVNTVNACFNCTCSYFFNPVFQDWGKSLLFCAAYEIISGDNVTPRKEYMHAISREDALRTFNNMHARDKNIHLVDVARVIGYFVEGKKGQVLSV